MKTTLKVTPLKKVTRASEKERVFVATTKNTKKVAEIKNPILRNSKLPQKRVTNSSLALRQNVDMSILSPYRFPIDAELLAQKVARYSGVFFVVVGAFFSLLYASNSFSNATQLAAVSSSQTVADESSADECESESHTAITVCTKEVKKTPDVTFNIDSSDSAQGAVNIKLKVENATKVTLSAYNKNSLRRFELGAMTKVSDDTWRFDFDTLKYEDGTYTLKSLVENKYGIYEKVYSGTIIVENNPLVQDPVTPQNVSSVDTTPVVVTATTSVESESELLLTVNTKKSDAEFHFDMEVDDADSVKMYAYPESNKKSIFLGYAYSVDDSLWRYRWLASEYEPGQYKIVALALRHTSRSESNSVIVEKLPLTKKIDSETEQTASSTPTKTTEVLTPEIKIQLPNSHLARTEYVKIDVQNAALVELFVVPNNGLTRNFLGYASLVDTHTWQYPFNTTKIPNGSHKLVAVVTNQFGTYEKESSIFKINNIVAATYTKQQEEQVSQLKDISTVIADTKKAELETIKPVTARDDAATSTKKQDDVISEYTEVIQADLQRLATVLRSNNESEAQEIKNKLEISKKEIPVSDLDAAAAQELALKIDAHLKETVARVENDVKNTEKIIKERTREKTVKDSDSDGITDYDEVAIYKTDPFSADSDKDGFIDGAEILNGYNPIDPSPEVLVAYESPKDSGIIREDILEVQAIATASADDEVDQGEAQKTIAIISGKALPNSFITLYIYSTPIVVTIKTEDDGSWNYRFDKELEDGEHEIYVGVTDNAGKIVAKSNPFTFIKEAQAYTQKDTQGITQTDLAPVQQQTLLSEYMIYLVLSISVIAIGLVLMLLGFHLDARKKEFLVESEDVAV